MVVDLGNAADIAAPEVLDRISKLKACAVFDRWRGGPPYDKKALAEVLVRMVARCLNTLRSRKRT